MKICLIDNYDSFTYNLEHQLRSFDLVVDVVRNDETSIEVLTANAYDAFVIGPGPSNPKNAGISMELIKHFYKTTLVQKLLNAILSSTEKHQWFLIIKMVSLSILRIHIMS